jgi:glutathione S-transferase
MFASSVPSQNIGLASIQRGTGMPKATLSIASKNYGSWSLRGWLLCKLVGLDFQE